MILEKYPAPAINAMLVKIEKNMVTQNPVPRKRRYFFLEPEYSDTYFVIPALIPLTIGYLVNLNGDILFPVLGKIHAQGLTKSQLQALLTKQLVDTKQLIDPIVTIRQLNFRVSVLGEVSKPGVYTTPNEKISLLEALSFAGDITIYGKKDNVLLIREDDKGDKLIVRIDLTSSGLFTSPYYYLKSNDVIYVEPSQNREKKERFAQVTPIILSVVSLLIITISAIEYRK